MPGIFARAAIQKSRFSRRRSSISRIAISPQSRAVSPARWAKLGACEMMNSFSRVARAARSFRATSHPTRQPVMQYAFENDWTTTTASSRVAFLRMVGAAIRSGNFAFGRKVGVVQPLVHLVSHQPDTVPARKLEKLRLLLDLSPPIPADSTARCTATAVCAGSRRLRAHQNPPCTGRPTEREGFVSRRHWPFARSPIHSARPG